MDHLFEVLQMLAHDVENHIRSNNHGRLEGERINHATTARKYADVVKYAFHLLDGMNDLPIYWKLRRLNHDLQLATVFADDRIYLADISDEVFEREELKPGEVSQFLRQHEYDVPLEGPYPTKEENLAFFEAQKGGYPRDTFGFGHLDDDHDTRDLNENWAEYLEPQGMGEFYATAEWQALMDRTRWAFSESERLIKAGELNQRWTWVRENIRDEVEDAFDAAVMLYLQGSLNSTAVALVAHKFTSGTRFKQKEMNALLKVIPAISHIDGQKLGASLYQWIDWNREELDEVLEDGEDGFFGSAKPRVVLG